MGKPAVLCMASPFSESDAMVFIPKVLDSLHLHAADNPMVAGFGSVIKDLGHGKAVLRSLVDDDRFNLSLVIGIGSDVTTLVCPLDPTEPLLPRQVLTPWQVDPLWFIELPGFEQTTFWLEEEPREQVGEMLAKLCLFPPEERSN